MADIQINGLDSLFHKLDSVSKVHTVLEPPMVRAQTRILRRLTVYPPRPGSKYRRTFTLQRKWLIAPLVRANNGLTGKVGTDLEYAPLVQSAKFQRPIHRGIWTNTDEVVLAQELPAITADFNATVQAELDK
jgi:hypothetical protein